MLISFIKTKIIQFRLVILYIFFAGIATLADLGVLYWLTEKFGLWYFYSALISFIVGMIVNYSLNKVFNFKNRSRKIWQQFGLFIIVAIVGLALNQLIMYVVVEYLELWYVLAKLVSIFFVFFWSFFGHRRLTFRIYQ